MFIPSNGKMRKIKDFLFQLQFQSKEQNTFILITKRAAQTTTGKALFAIENYRAVEIGTIKGMVAKFKTVVSTFIK
ncbi:hypothetical protein [Leptospira mayottensis]|uniref:Uncharacterized protein n=3 Tax=Leptospira mayottensis TaxID=1137606 RepID=A0AA87MJA7_9LEPT|nr:hypothetical protein [Leptospira mayottensis]AZQ03650.1 hypothetical protein LEP1GSC190_03120 [Leptospira mayottensis 200901116]EKR98160.1 hypothetical protein LEP1GSC125_1106 [Leptospira mayottensis 200901122]AXR62271.1 hypothetical protein DQM68_00865 [Leptospira mayottensis]AXR65987.1 hypothetical protein DQM28_02485 [Leptospira mayottensis]AXR69671.1 hypothetical protein DPV73_02370 [Leptospira mayottensis]